MIQFLLQGDYVPLIQLLKATNLVYSGGEAQTVVENGLVKCNGTIEHRKRLKVKRGDVVEFNQKKVIVK